MNPVSPLRIERILSLFKRLLFPTLLGLVLAFILMRALRMLDIRALTLLLICLSFVCFSVIFRCFERAVFGFIFLMVPINVDINFEIGPTLYAMRLPMGTILLNLSLIDIAVLTLYPMWIIRVLSNREAEKIIWPAGGVPFLLFMAWGLMSMFNAPNKLLASLEVACFLKTFLCFFYLANHLKTRENIWFAIRCLLVGLLIQSLIGLAQQALQGNLGLGILGERKEEKLMKMVGGKDPVFRIGGTLGHPTFYGGYLAALLPLSLSVALLPAAFFKKAVSWTVFVLGAMVLVFSYCRSAWVVTAVSLPAILFYWLRDYFRTHTFQVGPLIGLFVVGLCVAAPFAPMIHERMTQDDKGSTDSRIPQWKMGMEMIKAHPFLGVGLNNYNVVSDLYEPYVADENTMTRVFYFGSKIHNVYLGVAAQAGMVGLFFYLLTLRNIIRHGWRKSRLTEDPETRLALIAMVFGVTAMLIHESVHTGNISGNMILWILAACLAGPLAQENLKTPAVIHE